MPLAIGDAAKIWCNLYFPKLALIDMSLAVSHPTAFTLPDQSIEETLAEAHVNSG